jgi:hypothetical protein
MPDPNERFPFIPSIFWGNQPSGPGSYEALQARRKIAESLLGKRSPFPKTLGEGLTYAGERFGDAMMLSDLDRRQAEEDTRVAEDVTAAGRRPATTTSGATPPATTSPSVAGPTPTSSPETTTSDYASLRPQPSTLPTAEARNRVAAAVAAQTPPGGPVGNAPNMFSPPAINPATGVVRRLPTQPPYDRFSTEFGPLASVSNAQVSTADSSRELTTENIGKALLSPQPMTGGTPSLAYGGGGVPDMTPHTIARPAPLTPPGSRPIGVGGGPYGPDSVEGGGDTQPSPPVRLAANLVPAAPTTNIPSAPVAPTNIPSAPPAGAPNTFTPPTTGTPNTFSLYGGPLPPQTRPAEPPVTKTTPYGEPPQPPRTPQTPRELNAINMLRSVAGNPRREAVWRSVIAEEEAERKYTDARNDELYKSRLHVSQTDFAESQKALRAQEAEQRKQQQEERERGVGAPTALPVPTRAEDVPAYNASLNRQVSGVPDVGPKPRGLTYAEHAKSAEKDLREQFVKTKQVVPEVTNALWVIDKLLNDPAFDKAAGLEGMFLRNLPETEAKRVAGLLNQVNGEAFLTSVQQLRGLGAVANKEGEAATRARVSIDPQMRAKDQRAALIDLKTTIRRDLETAQRGMNLPVTAWRGPNDNFSFAPNVGHIARIDGELRQYIGGDDAELSSWRPMRLQ